MSNNILNPYFANSNDLLSQGEDTERDLLEDLIIESIGIFGQEFRYIPRTYVAKDEILGEDRLSTFENSFPIPCYLESVNGFEGQGAFIDKFGLMNQKSATLSIARATWKELVSDVGKTILPNRPSEGDLLFFPLTGGLFEIKFVQHQDPFYQVGKLYVYKVDVELYRYASESIETGDSDIDIFNGLKSHDVLINADPDVVESFGDNTKIQTAKTGVVFNTTNPFGDA